MRPQHTHIFQSHREPVDRCPACDLIRVEVMKAPIRMIRAGVFGPPLTPGDRDA